MSASDNRPLLLLVGGAGGLVGRNALPELLKTFRVRSVHRHPVPEEARTGVETVPADIAGVSDWARLLDGVEVVLNLAWYRHGSDQVFRPLTEGLVRLIRASEAAGVSRFVHVSVPEAPEALETGLPYLARKREVDRALEESRLSFATVRPTMLFGAHDRLLTVMLRLMARYRWFPMFGDGEYHVSPLSVRDLGRILRAEALSNQRHSVLAGGPRRWRYRDLTDEMFRALGRRPRYVTLSPRSSVRVARLFETVGSSLIYAYEVEWLLSDLLGLSPYPGGSAPLEPVEPFLRLEAGRLLGV